MELLVVGKKMKSIIADVKSAIDNNNISDALKLCCDADKLEGGENNFLLQSTGGQCAFQLNQLELAEVFF